jgi:hypothetical protein
MGAFTKLFSRLKLTSEINPPSKGIAKGGWFKKS